eukprot:2465012-Ditylum_brightwellii.AAC.1
MILCCSKETLTCIGYLTSINSFRVDRLGYQDSINGLLEGTAEKNSKKARNALKNMEQPATRQNT